MRVGIIGCGEMGRNAHFPAFRRLGLEVVGVADVDPAKMKAFRKNVMKFTDYRQLLDEKLDLVSICAPDGLHAEMCVAAAKASTNILVEKPLATTLKDCERIRHAVRKHGVQLCVMHNCKFFEPFQKLRAYVNDGRLGRIISASMTYHTHRGYRWQSHKRLGSPLAVHATHLFYTLEWLFGPPRLMTGRRTRNAMIGQFIYDSYPVNAVLSEFRRPRKHLFEIDVYGYNFHVQARDPPDLRVNGYNIRSHLRSTLVSGVCQTWRMARVLALLRHRASCYKTQDSVFLLIRDLVAGLKAGRDPPAGLDEGIRAVEYGIKFDEACRRHAMPSI